jgi:hypothetical protein
MRTLKAPLVLLIALVVIIQVLPFSGALDRPNDVFISSIEVIQVVEGPIGVIRGKSTGLQLGIGSTFPETVLVDIQITYDFGRKTYIERGPDGHGVPLTFGRNTVYVPGGGCTAHPEGWNTDPMTFIWTSLGNDPSVSVRLDPSNEVLEGSETNNEMTFTSGVEVVYSRPMRVLVIPVRNEEAKFDYDLEENLRVLRDQYPVADNGIQVVTGQWRFRNYTGMEEASDIARSFSAHARALGYDKVIVVFKKLYYGSGELYGRACGMLRDPEDRTPFLVTASGLSHSSDLLAHELGHTYYLWHPHDVGIEVYGTDIWSCQDRQYGSPASTTMSYDWNLPPDVPSSPRWMDEQRYQSYPKTWIDLSNTIGCNVDGVWEWNLYSQFVTDVPPLLPSLLVSGTLFPNGSALLGSVRPLASAVRDLGPVGFGHAGNYSIRLLDSGRGLLGSYPFKASFVEYEHWDMETEVIERQLAELPFAFNVPDIPGTRYVQLTGLGGTPLAERQASDHSPAVTLTSPEGGGLLGYGETINITWSGEDPDGDPLDYLLAYSSDRGDSWVPIADGLTSGSYSWDTAGLEPGSGYLLKVMASDGFHSAEGATDGTFSLIDETPPVTSVILEGTEGLQGWHISPVLARLNASDDHRVNRTELSLDGVTWNQSNGSVAINDEGITTLHYRSVDASGNVEDAQSIQVRIDRTAPQVHIVSIVQGAKVKTGDLLVQWTSSDANSGIAGHMVRLDGGTWQDAGAAVQWQLSEVSEGTHTLEVIALDRAGNTNTSIVQFQAEGPDSTLTLLMAGAVIVAVMLLVSLMAIRWRRK